MEDSSLSSADQSMDQPDLIPVLSGRGNQGTQRRSWTLQNGPGIKPTLLPRGSSAHHSPMLPHSNNDNNNCTLKLLSGSEFPKGEETTLL